MPPVTFKSFYPRWVGWNMLGLGVVGAILTVLEFSGLMGNGLYARVQSTLFFVFFLPFFLPFIPFTFTIMMLSAF